MESKRNKNGRRLNSFLFLDFSATQRELSKALQDEIEAEQKLEAENLGGSSSPSIPGFKITTNDAEVRLTKSHGDEQ